MSSSLTYGSSTYTFIVQKINLEQTPRDNATSVAPIKTTGTTKVKNVKDMIIKHILITALFVSTTSKIAALQAFEFLEFIRSNFDKQMQLKLEFNDASLTKTYNGKVIDTQSIVVDEANPEEASLVFKFVIEDVNW